MLSCSFLPEELSNNAIYHYYFNHCKDDYQLGNRKESVMNAHGGEQGIVITSRYTLPSSAVYSVSSNG